MMRSFTLYSRITLVAMASVALAGAAVADDLFPPSWRLSSASATVQEWEFLTPTNPLGPDGNTWGGGNEVNPFGPPVAVIGGGIWQSSLGSRLGQWVLSVPNDLIDLQIPNTAHQNGLKTVWVQITYADPTGAGPKVALLSSSFSGPMGLVSSIGLADGFTHSTYALTFGPCPEREIVRISGGVPGAALFVDQVVVDTICTPVPEPATMAALGLGVVALVRRRSRKSS